MASGILFVCYANLCRSPMAEYIARDMLARRLGAVEPGVVGPGAVEHPGRLPVPVSSAGTHAVPGYRMHPHAAAVTAALGADPDRFRSRPLTADIIARAGLVLAATRRERAVCVSLVPTAMRRTFTLRQFGRLARAAGALPVDAAAVDAASALPVAGPGAVPRSAPAAPPAGSGAGRGGTAARRPAAERDAPAEDSVAAGRDRVAGHDPAAGESARLLAAAVAAAVRARGRLQPVEPGDDDLADPIGQPVEAFHECAGQIEAALAPVVALISACR